jgi:hypothetical protein
MALEQDRDFPFCLGGYFKMRPKLFLTRIAYTDCQGWRTLFNVKTYRAYGLPHPTLPGLTAFPALTTRA